MNAPTITLGPVEIEVYAQRHAYLTNRLGRFMPDLVAGAEGLGSFESLVVFLGDASYDVLAALIPNLEKRYPRWQYRGFGSQEAMEAGEYYEQKDECPTFPEIVEAFEVAARVNRFDVLGGLTKIVDPSLLRSTLNVRLAEALTSGPSVSSPLPNGGSVPSTSSGTSVPT